MSVQRMVFLVGVLALASMFVGGARLLADLGKTRDAFLFAFGPYTFASTLTLFTDPTALDERAGWNTLLHADRLADPEQRSVTMPNVDTIYSVAGVDLSEGPVRLEVPEERSRYHSIALLDPLTDNTVYIGTRTTLGVATSFLIAPPDWDGQSDDDTTIIRAPAEKLWLLLRVLVDGKDDLAAARETQRKFVLKGPATPTVASATHQMPPTAQQFLARTNLALSWLPTGHPQAVRSQRFQDLGLGAYAGDPSAYQRLLWHIVLSRGITALETGVQESTDGRSGWQRPPPSLGRFGDDDKVRAGVALIGLGALEAEEAIYITTDTDSEGHRLTGDRNHHLRIPPEGLPAEAFWSITVYERAEDGRYFLYDNAIARYAISDRTKNLSYQPDGSLLVELGHEQPIDPTNWLPVPQGEYRLTTRLYIPQAKALEADWLPPPVVPVAK